MIIRPFEFTKEAILERAAKWIAEWLALFAVVVFILTLGYLEPSWKFQWITYLIRLKKNK